MADYEQRIAEALNLMAETWNREEERLKEAERRHRVLRKLLMRKAAELIGRCLVLKNGGDCAYLADDVERKCDEARSFCRFVDEFWKGQREARKQPTFWPPVPSVN